MLVLVCSESLQSGMFLFIDLCSLCGRVVLGCLACLFLYPSSSCLSACHMHFGLHRLPNPKHKPERYNGYPDPIYTEAFRADKGKSPGAHFMLEVFRAIWRHPCGHCTRLEVWKGSWPFGVQGVLPTPPDRRRSHGHCLGCMAKCRQLQGLSSGVVILNSKLRPPPLPRSMRTRSGSSIHSGALRNTCPSPHSSPPNSAGQSKSPKAALPCEGGDS